MSPTEIATSIREYVTAAAILTGGGWALWRWGFEEWLRRQRDFPALDGEIRTVDAKLGDGKVVVTVNALWRNRGRLPVEIDPNRVSLHVHQISPASESGPVDPKSDNAPLCYTAHPLAGLVTYILEPGTDSVIQQCLILPDDKVFLFRWQMPMASNQRAYRYLKSELWWVRQHVWRSGPSVVVEVSAGT